MEYFKYCEDGQCVIVRTNPTLFIPMASGNIDYQEFLSYCTENNLTIDDIPLYVP